MAQFPALPLWTDAYIADTQHLTNEEHGVYLRLLMFAWRTPDCSLPDDDRRLALMVGVTPKKWASLKAAVMVFWSLEDERWMQKRLTAEREFVERNRKQKSAAGIASSEAKALKKKGTASTAVAEPLVTATSTERQQPIPIPINKNILSETGSDNAPEKKGKISYPEAFESFWNAYPRSANMAKKETFDAWKKLTAEEREQCIGAVPGYIAFLKSKPTLETIHACRFISKRRFEGFASAGSEAPAAVDDEKWLKRLRYGRREGAWSSASWGAVSRPTRKPRSSGAFGKRRWQRLEGNGGGRMSASLQSSNERTLAAARWLASQVGPLSHAAPTLKERFRLSGLQARQAIALARNAPPSSRLDEIGLPSDEEGKA